MDPVLRDQISGVVRILIPLLLTVAVSKGWVAADKAGPYGDAIATGILGAITAGAVFWSIWRNRKLGQIQAVAQMPEVKKVVTTTDIAQNQLPAEEKVVSH